MACIQLFFLILHPPLSPSLLSRLSLVRPWVPSSLSYPIPFDVSFSLTHVSTIPHPPTCRVLNPPLPPSTLTPPLHLLTPPFSSQKRICWFDNKNAHIPHISVSQYTPDPLRFFLNPSLHCSSGRRTIISLSLSQSSPLDHNNHSSTTLYTKDPAQARCVILPLYSLFPIPIPFHQSSSSISLLAPNSLLHPTSPCARKPPPAF